MIINSQIKYPTYLKLMMRKYFFHVRIILYLSIVLGFWTLALLQKLGKVAAPEDALSNLLYGLGLGVLILIRTYYSISNNYKSTPLLHEIVQYTFTSEGISSVGQSFSASVSWSQIVRIEEKTDFFLIYQSSSLMLVISKENFTSVQIEEFREMVKITNKAKLIKV
ncbi:MAG TPA: YcxB family protein [Paludibacter sp.]|nr:YcxB family protein [Paludibacter sp.]